MSDETTSQNPISTENSTPQSSQEPTEHAPENIGISEPPEATQEPQEAQGEDFGAKAQSEPLPENDNIEQNQGHPDQTPQPEKAEQNEEPEPETAQMEGNEPFDETHDKPLEHEEPEPEEEKQKLSPQRSKRIKQLLEMARDKIQFKKRKKLEKVLILFEKKQKITNDEVEKLLHVSDATATRYLSELEKKGKIRQNGRTGKGVSYSRI